MITTEAKILAGQHEKWVLPQDIKEQVEWEKLEGVVILGLKGKGLQNTIAMSSLAIEELVMLSKQLDAHVTCLLGPMKEV